MSDPKRPITGPDRDPDRRDRYVAKHRTPTLGVQTPVRGVPTRPEPPESWEDQSSGGRESTGVHARQLVETPIQTITRRSGETKNGVLQLHERLHDLESTLADLRVEAARSTAQNELILEALAEQRAARERSGLLRVTERTAEVEVGKLRALTEIEAEAEGRKLRRELTRTIALRVVAGIGVAWAAISAALLARCGA